MKEEFEDIKGVIRSRKSMKNKHYNSQRKGTKWQTTIYNTVHRKLKIEQHEPHLKLGMISGAPEGYAVTAPHVIPVVLLLLQTRW